MFGHFKHGKINQLIYISIKVFTKSLSKRFKDGFKKDGCQVPVSKPAVSASFLEVNAWSFCSLRRRPKTSTNWWVELQDGWNGFSTDWLNLMGGSTNKEVLRCFKVLSCLRKVTWLCNIWTYMEHLGFIKWFLSVITPRWFRWSSIWWQFRICHTHQRGERLLPQPALQQHLFGARDFFGASPKMSPV